MTWGVSPNEAPHNWLLLFFNLVTEVYLNAILKTESPPTLSHPTRKESSQTEAHHRG